MNRVSVLILGAVFVASLTVVPSVQGAQIMCHSRLTWEAGGESPPASILCGGDGGGGGDGAPGAGIPDELEKEQARRECLNDCETQRFNAITNAEHAHAACSQLAALGTAPAFVGAANTVKNGASSGNPSTLIGSLLLASAQLVFASEQLESDVEDCDAIRDAAIADANADYETCKEACENC